MAKFRIGLGVCGGIAAYKAIEVLRLLQKAGCDVSVAMTKHATEFIQPLTFRALTGEYVIVDDYDADNPDPIAHVNFSQNIDLLLIVPATANTIAKFANGVADDFLSSTYLASTAPVLIAPAMNVTMWENPATQRNIAQLKKDRVHFVEPVEGELACKTVGTGKLEDVENIVEQALSLLRGVPAEVQRGRAGAEKKEAPAESQRGREGEEEAPAKTQRRKCGKGDLEGESILITVGGTREAIDPVRYISNHSSGKMGFAVAEAAAARGAGVTVIAGAVSVAPPDGASMVWAMSASEMHSAVMKELEKATVFIGSAAVADYAPVAAGSKIKKDGKEKMTLELEKTPDILSEVSSKRSNGQIVVGFAAETNDVIEYARSKMTKKGLDIVVANDITEEGAGFNTDTNIATIITRDGHETDLPLMSKRELADKILDEVVRLRKG
jgi:phosphopantothenoylcysteine decarboxylase/phosphopantothenate--cysteine ligase